MRFKQTMNKLELNMLQYFITFSSKKVIERFTNQILLSYIYNHVVM